MQDLAIWIPLFAVAASACWQRRPWGYLVTGAALVMLALEAVGVATDQWFGSQADPTSPAASMTMVPVFAGLAVLIGTVLARHLYSVDRHLLRYTASGTPTAPLLRSGASSIVDS